MFEMTNPIWWPSSYDLGRWAPRERSRVMNALMRDAARKFARWLAAGALASARLAHSLAAEGRRRSAIRMLHELDDRILSDIGVPRSEIEFVVRDRCPAGGRRRTLPRQTARILAQRRAAA